MNKLVTILFLLLGLYNISSAQTGWGYVNYTSYKTHNGTGDQSQYNAFANNAAGFDVMMNTANSNTTITHTGEVPISYVYNGSSQIPRWSSDYFAYKIEFFFVPQQTGTYYFGINSDDASDLSMDGTVIVTYYGGHGASSWQTVPKNLIAGQKYKMVLRGQEFGGGESLSFMWYRPVGGWGYWNNEVTNIGLVEKTANFKFLFNGGIDPTTFSGKMAYFTNPNIWTNISTTAKSLSSVGKVDMSADFDTTKTNMGFIFEQYPAASLSALTNQIVTVSDVYLAFKELANKGLNGSSGNEFTSGVQYMNADVNGDGAFNEEDTYRLLQHLTGVRNLTDNCNTLSCWMKLMHKSQYNDITKTNWNTYSNNTRDTFAPLTPIAGTLTYDYYISVFWKGDVNLSHSHLQATPATNSVGMMNRTIAESNVVNASIVSENVGGKVVVTIQLDPLQQSVVGTQFQLNYDNTSLQFEKVECNAKATNFGNDMGSYINLGSLVTDGSTTLDKTTEYKITFTPLVGIEGTLGLTSISTTDAVNKNGTQLKINVN